MQVMSWRVLSSQDKSRRNAQRAAIICAQRRREREEVERFLAEVGQARIETGRTSQRR